MGISLLPSFVAVSICHPHPPSFSLILSLYLAFENSTFIVALHIIFAQIASGLGLSINTVKSYCRRNALPVGGVDSAPK